MPRSISVVMLGATGAVGGHTARTLARLPEVARLSLLGRRPVEGLAGGAVEQHVVDILAPSSYRDLLPGHDTAVCTLGVGEPSKMSKAEFVRIDRDAVLDFAAACKQVGVRHFELLGSAGASATSSLFYLRTKGQLEEGLKALGFERLSLFQPSMILTPTNRYGLLQGITLFAFPLLKPLLVGPLRKARGIRVDRLGAAIAMNVLTEAAGVETLQWDDFMRLSRDVS